jgi:hypothetical protein
MAAFFSFIALQGRRFMKEGGILKSALIGGIPLGVLSALTFTHFSCCCCIWAIGGGALAAYVYVRESKIVATLGRGVALGLNAGVIGTIISAVFLVPIFLINKVSLLDQLRQSVDKVKNAPAESRQLLANMLAGEGVLGLILVVLFILMLISYCFLGMAGGAIGVAIFEKRTPEPESSIPTNFEPPAGPTTPPPPSPPDDEPL